MEVFRWFPEVVRWTLVVVMWGCTLSDGFLKWSERGPKAGKWTFAAARWALEIGRWIPEVVRWTLEVVRWTREVGWWTLDWCRGHSKCSDEPLVMEGNATPIPLSKGRKGSQPPQSMGRHGPSTTPK